MVSSKAGKRHASYFIRDCAFAQQELCLA
jgi:hypothetical protein